MHRNNDISSRTYICRMGGRLGSKPLNLEEVGKGKRIRDVISRTSCHVRMCIVVIKRI